MALTHIRFTTTSGTRVTFPLADIRMKQEAEEGGTGYYVAVSSSTTWLPVTEQTYNKVSEALNGSLLDIDAGD